MLLHFQESESEVEVETVDATEETTAEEAAEPETKGKGKEDEVYVRLKYAVNDWFTKNRHNIDTSSKRFKPK